MRGSTLLPNVYSGAEFGMLIVETIAKVRRAYFVEGKSIKAICRDLKVSRKVTWSGKTASLKPDVPVLYMSGYAGFTDEQIGDVKAPLLQKPSPPPRA